MQNCTDFWSRRWKWGSSICKKKSGYHFDGYSNANKMVTEARNKGLEGESRIQAICRRQTNVFI
jgi:hypothetical protein